MPRDNQDERPATIKMRMAPGGRLTEGGRSPTEVRLPPGRRVFPRGTDSRRLAVGRAGQCKSSIMWSEWQDLNLVRTICCSRQFSASVTPLVTPTVSDL